MSASNDDSTSQDIDNLHSQACERGETTYVDPLTGRIVFTKLYHLRRGECCGSGCRHCPYDYRNCSE